MKVWILVGVLDGSVNDVDVFHNEEDANKAQEKWNKEYSFPEITSNEVILFGREIQGED